MQPNYLIAIDPGYDRCGIAVMDISPTSPILVFSTCITTPKTLLHEQRLAVLHTETKKIIETWKPTSFAIETLFFSVNKTTALKVAEARGVLMALAGIYNQHVIELSPQTIKQSITGNGSANKIQIEKMVTLLLRCDLSKKHDDEIDAIAIAIAASPIAKRKIF